MVADGFNADELLRIRESIREKYAEVSIAAAGKFKYLTGREGAQTLGYDAALLDEFPPELFHSFCGVGNPFALDEIEKGSSVLDIGCGAGFDLVVAARLTGPQGRVVGIDLTSEMIARAEKNLNLTDLENIEVMSVDSEELPFEDAMFDVIISNGVINLSPCKEQLFKEAQRVLKPGGRLQFADIVAETELPSSLTGSLEAWSQ